MGMEVIKALNVSELIVEDLKIETADGVNLTKLDTAANATANVTISNVAPAAVGTATISKWLRIVIKGDDTYYIPLWT